jgi:hypothetical protein
MKFHGRAIVALLPKEKLRNAVDLIVMTTVGKRQQLFQEFG